MTERDATPHGITVLDIHDGRWALWQVSATTMNGPLRATSTNAVVTDGFDEKAFLSLTYRRPVLLTARARQVCTEPIILEAAPFDPEQFIADYDAWINLLQGMFWAENDRRAEAKAENARRRKEAKAAGAPAVESKRLAPLKDIDWPGAPPGQRLVHGQELPGTGHRRGVARGQRVRPTAELLAGHRDRPHPQDPPELPQRNRRTRRAPMAGTSLDHG